MHGPKKFLIFFNPDMRLFVYMYYYKCARAYVLCGILYFSYLDFFVPPLFPLVQASEILNVKRNGGLKGGEPWYFDS